MNRKRTATQRAYILIEAVTALGLLGLILAGAYASIRVNEQMLRRCVDQRQALDVLDNLVERVAVDAPVPLARCRAVLADEMALSPLTERPRVESLCEPTDSGGVRCAIICQERVLAEVRIGGHE